MYQAGIKIYFKVPKLSLNCPANRLSIPSQLNPLRTPTLYTSKSRFYMICQSGGVCLPNRLFACAFLIKAQASFYIIRPCYFLNKVLINSKNNSDVTQDNMNRELTQGHLRVNYYFSHHKILINCNFQ